MPSLSLLLAQRLADAAVRRAGELELAVSVVVTDAAGHDVLALRMDGAPWISVGVARAKARTSVAMNADTADLAGLKAAYPELIEQITDQLSFRVTTLPGGILLRSGANTVGAVAVSGGPPHLDVECAAAGAFALD